MWLETTNIILENSWICVRKPLKTLEKTRFMQQLKEATLAALFVRDQTRTLINRMNRLPSWSLHTSFNKKEKKSKIDETTIRWLNMVLFSSKADWNYWWVAAATRVRCCLKFIRIFLLIITRTIHNLLNVKRASTTQSIYQSNEIFRPSNKYIWKKNKNFIFIRKPFPPSSDFFYKKSPFQFSPIRSASSMVWNSGWYSSFPFLCVCVCYSSLNQHAHFSSPSKRLGSLLCIQVDPISSPLLGVRRLAYTVWQGLKYHIYTIDG